MSKGLLAAKIGGLRRSKGLSQEELAESASINLRTVQRIETGKTEPRGQTLRLIAKALNTPIEEFLDFTQEEDTGFLQLLNLSALSFWLIPLGNIFLPLALWVLKRDKIKGANELGRRIINFQITWTLIVYSFAFIIMFDFLRNFSFVFPGFLVIPVSLSLYFLNSVLILVANFQIRRGGEKVYSIGFPILR
ncbi:hypothetical protein GCM10027347_32830 [Larkinella harenae]